jgi:hypothetical protein
MRRLLVALMFLAATSPAWAQKIDRTEVVEYGIFTADKLKSQRDANGQMHSIIGNVQLEEATTTVPAERGVKFGFRYRVIGEPDGKAVAIRKVMIFPPPGLKAPNAPQPLTRSEDSVTPPIGETSYTGFEFDDPWELVPGIWTMQLWQGNKMLVEQRFTVLVGRGI